MRRLGSLFLVLVLALTANAGCDSDPNEGATELLELARRQRVVWQNQNIDDYSMTYQIGCSNCPASEAGPFEVFVRDGVRDSVLYLGQPLGADSLDQYFTVNSLFDFIEAGFARNPDRTSLVFDPDRGFPVSVIFDYDVRRSGEEDAVLVRQLQELDG